MFRKPQDARLISGLTGPVSRNISVTRLSRIFLRLQSRPGIPEYRSPAPEPEESGWPAQPLDHPYTEDGTSGYHDKRKTALHAMFGSGAA